jgi:hypothetical protein
MAALPPDMWVSKPCVANASIEARDP